MFFVTNSRVLLLQRCLLLLSTLQLLVLLLKLRDTILIHHNLDLGLILLRLALNQFDLGGLVNRIATSTLYLDSILSISSPSSRQTFITGAVIARRSNQVILHHDLYYYLFLII